MCVYYHCCYKEVFLFLLQRHETLTPTPEGDPVYVNRAALLPAYRPSPDYDAVMQQRMLQQQQPHFDEITPHLGAAQVYVHPDGMAYSQPEISQSVASYRDEHGNYANVDALRSYSHSIYANIFQDGHGYYPGRGSERGNNLAVHPTYSSPELNTEIHQQEVFAANEFSAQEAMTYHFRPPPPYPRTSSSTPDLAAQPASNLVGTQPDIVLPNLVTAGERTGLHDFVVQSRLDRSVDDLSGFQMNAPYSVSGIRTTTELSSENSHSGVTSVLGKSGQPSSGRPLEVINTDSGSGDTSAGTRGPSNQGSFLENDLTSASESKIMSDDPDDTSSEHSYSTFHAKESDESSDDEGARPKPAQTLKESNIHIRMFTPQEAPPPSKIKEEATLRESFRRMKIVRTSSLSKDVPGLKTSLCGLKEAVEVNALSLHSNVAGGQRPESEALQSSVAQSSFPSSHTTVVDKNLSTTPEMEEILERLGAPPPYPGKSAVPPDLVSDVPAMRNTSSATQNSSNLPQGSLVTVKRSSSVGMAPLKTAPLLPPRMDQSGTKPRAATLNLDMVVPISKPGVIRMNDSSTSTSVLRAESSKSLTGGGDGDNCRILTDKDPGSTNEREVSHEDRDDASDSLTSLREYSIGSDSDSDREQVKLVIVCSFVMQKNILQSHI